MDSLGRLLVADTYNYRVQAFHSDGTLVAMWGADGWGNAPLWYPRGIATTREGDILVVSENTLRVFAPLSAN